MNIKDYKKDYVCYFDEYGDIVILGTDDIENIKEAIAEGYTVYGTTEEIVFKDNFAEEVRDLFEDHALEYGYPDMNDYIDYDGSDFVKVKTAIKEFIESLGETNKCYYADKNIKIEL